MGWVGLAHRQGVGAHRHARNWRVRAGLPAGSVKTGLLVTMPQAAFFVEPPDEIHHAFIGRVPTQRLAA